MEEEAERDPPRYLPVGISELPTSRYIDLPGAGRPDLNRPSGVKINKLINQDLSLPKHNVEKSQFSGYELIIYNRILLMGRSCPLVTTPRPPRQQKLGHPANLHVMATREVRSEPYLEIGRIGTVVMASVGIEIEGRGFYDGVSSSFLSGCTVRLIDTVSRRSQPQRGARGGVSTIVFLEARDVAYFLPLQTGAKLVDLSALEARSQPYSGAKNDRPMSSSTVPASNSPTFVHVDQSIRLEEP